MKVFLIGRPGSGKSTVAGIIEKSARDRGWITQHIYDYGRLHSMFQEEIDDKVPLERRKFRPAGTGFDVVDFGVLEMVLNQIAEAVRQDEANHPHEQRLYLLEFARREYSRALHIFGNQFLQDAHVLYVKADLKLCIERVHERAKLKQTKFDHDVSDKIMQEYYAGDDWSGGQLSQYLDYLQRDKVNLHFQILDNTSTLQELKDQVDRVVNQIIPELVLA